MQRRRKIVAAAAAVAAAVMGGSAWAVTGGVDDDATQVPISGAALDKASAAALEHTGGGHVTETELDDEESDYEVEVTLEDGSTVDVQLDEAFQVVGDEDDDDASEDGSGS